MKRILAVTIILTILISMFSLPVAGAENISRPYEIMEDFVNAHPHRESGTEGNEEASVYISAFFKELNYSVEEQKFTFNLMGNTYGIGEPVEERNIIAQKDVGSNRTIVVGAHYDNVFSSGEGQGAYDNGSGIGVMLALAEKLADTNLEYNLVFCAFGGEEYGLYGSKYYLDNLSTIEKDKILLYVNIDSIAAGDNLYIYCDEVKTLHEDYFLNAAEVLGLKVLATPDYKCAAGVYTTGDKLFYTHTGLASDNATFFNAGIMTVSFSAFTWEREKVEQVNESTVHENIMHTENDNISKIEEYYGESAKEKMDAVYTLLYETMTSEKFVESMLYAKENNPDYSLLSNGILVAIISIGILIVLCVVVSIIISVNKKKYGSGNRMQEQKREDPPEVFSDF